ncbi:sensor histidine kinase [Novosphingobium sp. B 225]|uniref:sensor histidine kinase n=1 Tax=Novosphingobium sp. B 225 TaxID=1961849 RepID=UPI000B4A9BA6|nr:ATP-binding protein [Novosphingobium sp. B 225]
MARPSLRALSSRLAPRSLQGQLLLAVALALLAAQAISTALLWRAQSDRREATLVHTAAIRLVGANRESERAGRDGDDHGPRLGSGPHPPELLRAARHLRIELSAQTPLRAGERRSADAEAELREIMINQGIAVGDVIVTHRALEADPRMARRMAARAAVIGHRGPPPPDHLLIAGIQLQPTGNWMVVRVPVPRVERALIATILGQTLLLYGLLVGVIAFIVGRITRPLKALTRRLERFAETRQADGQLEPEGPDDIRHLILAQNAMEGRIATLLDEKDVMLGAIGHDLKTPLAALRVRIESVEDETERAKMAGTIEDITRSLDDILSLARVGRPTDPREIADLSALVAQVAEEYEDMGEPVTLAPGERLVMPLRATWLRRALRNLIGNALRYGTVARVSLLREGGQALIRVEDDGPGIPEADLPRMLEPFTRGEPSRNSLTGGAGLGLTLARAIAEQHGGKLVLVNRLNPDSSVAGLTATIALPV